MIYLIKAYGKDKILLKIGYTENLEKRKESYLTHAPDYELLLTREGDRSLEQDLQKYFEQYKYNNEWFFYSDEIVNTFPTINPPKRESRYLNKLEYNNCRKKFFRELNKQAKNNDSLFETLSKIFLKNNKGDNRTPEELVIDFIGIYNILKQPALNFLRQFFNAIYPTNKVRVLCIEASKLPNEELNNVFLFIPEVYKNLYLGLGPERCKALGYNYTALKKDYENKFFDSSRIDNEILNQFAPGNKLSGKNIKEFLQGIYNRLGYEKTAKATDLEKYFEVKRIKLKDPSGNWVHGLEILKIKS